MRLPGDLGDLTYCLNIHPTESWDQARTALEGPVAAVKQSLCPDGPFGVGLRLSGKGLADLAPQAERERLKRILSDGGLRPLTMNGFPFGPFHGTRVKEEVYQPDWRLPERLDYTTGLADLLAELAEPGDLVSLSTVPGTYRPLAEGAEEIMAEHLLRAAAHCARLWDRTGVTVALAVEPEPFCFLETIAGSIAFFDRYLYGDQAVRRFAELSGIPPTEAPDALRRHLGLCYDVCHAAVEFEDAAASIAALRRAGLPIHKLQLSAALRATISPRVREALSAFCEPTYLHQTICRTAAGSLRAYADLPEALARGAEADGEEWRIHFHVPVFLSDLGPFQSTQDFLIEILALHRKNPLSPHLEVETYSWDVMPERFRTETMEQAVIRELNWVLEKLSV